MVPRKIWVLRLYAMVFLAILVTNNALCNYMYDKNTVESELCVAEYQVKNLQIATM